MFAPRLLVMKPMKKTANGSWALTGVTMALRQQLQNSNTKTPYPFPSIVCQKKEKKEQESQISTHSYTLFRFATG
jgi:hypothetical protein